jgi:hypothetical protein
MPNAWLWLSTSLSPAPIDVSKISEVVPPSQVAPRNSDKGQRNHANAMVIAPNGTMGTKRRNNV